jgi:hypothetical protein
MPRKKEALTLSVPTGTKEKLEAIALKHDILWGKNPSPSGLVVAIASGELEVGQPFSLDAVRVKALRQAIKDLIDTGHVEEAQIIMTLLLERGNLETPLRQDLLKQVGQPMEAWRVRLNQLIQDKQPFHLAYCNSQGEYLEYTVRFAKILLYEGRMYLQIWCEETADSDGIPELQHNRCFRLDNRIQSILPIGGEWRDGLDEVKVQLHFKGRLLKAYESKEEDLSNEVIGALRRVVRRVSNPFWLYREVVHYFDDCEIIAPKNLRDRFQDKLRSLSQLYDLS